MIKFRSIKHVTEFNFVMRASQCQKTEFTSVEHYHALKQTPGMDIDEFKRQFGLRIQSHRRRCRMTQEDLAERIQRSTDTVSNIERGINSTRIETAFRIAEVLDVPLVELFDLASLGSIDRERRHLVEKLVDLVGREESGVLEAVIAQAEILLRVKDRAGG